MELSTQKWGNSAAVRLPTELLSMLKASLGDKLSVDVRPEGVALVNQVRMINLEERGAKKIETAPDFVVEDALARLQAITA